MVHDPQQEDNSVISTPVKRLATAGSFFAAS